VADWVPFIAGALAAVLLAPGALRSLAANGWTRPNYRGRELPFPAGVVAVAASLVALGVVVVLEELGAWDEPYRFVLALALGVAFLGLLDDLLDAPARGWRGHGREALRGGFSTGALKAVGTLCLAVATVPPGPFGEFAVSAVLVALTANLFNLLDLRPGRAVKVFAVVAVALVALTGTETLRAVGLFAGPLLGLGVYDLRERAMLGDTGSNVLGALAGIWLVAELGL
jgi:UDP-GlcNAc:undecaprenyl-phosphate/decaprenyl-phosphate GlcNAc-1-phosphate transferase